MKKICKDCKENPPKTSRPIVDGSGGRCATHWREEKARRKKAAHDRYAVRTYGLEPGEYDVLHKAQEGRCALCKKATGESRKLSNDHDHRTGLLRGLLCGPCNDFMGHARDDIAYFERAIEYLKNPPAIRFLGERHYQGE